MRSLDEILKSNHIYNNLQTCGRTDGYTAITFVGLMATNVLDITIAWYDGYLRTDSSGRVIVPDLRSVEEL